MKKLVTRLLKFTFLLALLVLSLFFSTGYLTRNHRLGSIIDKHARLEQIQGPKLVVIGGSNIHFGLDSELLERATGLPVVNMGVNGSLGTHFYFDEVIPWLGKSDLLLFLGEHSHYQGSKFAGEQPFYKLLSKYPRGLRSLSLKELMNAPTYVGTTIRENLEYLTILTTWKIRGNKTFRENTNERGDYIGHRDQVPTYQSPRYDTFQPATVSLAVVPFLQAMNRRVAARGASLLLGFASIDRYFVNPNLVADIDRVIPANFPGQHLGLASDYTLPDSLFFDTAYHLRYEFRNLRTRMLIDDLRAVGVEIIE